MPADEPLLLRFDTFELDERQARLTRGGRALPLAPKALGVLCALAREPGQLVRKDALLDAVWGHRHVSESVLKTIVSELRAALGDDAKRPRYIETASRHGYRFIAPIAAAPLASDPAVDAPRGAPAAHASLPPLVGRSAAGEQLHAAWRTATGGKRQIVWLTGEAGIGKSTLIERFVAELGPVTVAHGQCVEQRGAGEPYLPVLEALSAFCRADPSLATLLRSVAPTWLLQLPWLAGDSEREALRRELAGIGQERMLREFGEWFDRAASGRPLLLVTEDLHWSDHATLRLLDHLARRRGAAHWLWLASFRLAEVIAEDHPLKSLRHELRLHKLAREIALDPFSEREVADYLAQRLDAGAVPEPLVRELHARTDGLPLFVASVIDEWIARGGGALGAAPSSWPSSGVQLPESLAGVIEGQIQRLPPTDQQLLEAASVCGAEFSAATVADALGHDAAAVGERCDALARRQQWLAAQPVDRRSDGVLDARYAFRHALYRQVFYQRIGSHARVQWHRRVAASMQRRRDAGATVTAAELAMHHELGQDVFAALCDYADAAESALRRFAPTEVMTLTAHALQLLPQVADGPERATLELALLGPRAVATSQVVGVTAPEARTAFERLEQLCEQLPEQGQRALEMGLGWSLFVAGEYERALERARRKVALAERRGDRVLLVAACNLSGATLTYQGRLVEALHWLDRGLEAADGLGERLVDALAVVDLGVSLRSRRAMLLAHLGAIDQARQQIAAAHRRVDAIGQPYARRLVLIFEGFVAMRLGDAERVQEIAVAMQRVATEHGIAQADGPARWLMGWARAHLGEPLAGHALILDGYALDARLGVMRGRSGVLGYAAEALILGGRLDDAATQLDEAMALAEAMGERWHVPDLLLLRARVADGRGQTEHARAALRDALREAGEQRATWLELSAQVALCAMAPASRADLAALAATRARLHEGADTELMQRAQALLQRGA